MLLASLALHGALLLIPTAASDDAAIPPPDFEQDNIAITRIPPTAPPNEQSAETPVASTPVNSVGSPSNPGQTAAAGANATTSPANSRSTSPAQTQSQRSRASQASGQSPTNSSQAVPSLNAAAPANQSPPPSSSLPLTPVERQPFNPNIYQRLLAHAQTLTLPSAQISQIAARLTQQFTYSEQNTSDMEFNVNLAQWVESVKQAPGQSNLWNEAYEKPVSIQHYHRVCLNPAPHSAVVGAVVSPSGQLQGKPALLKSTGYGFLNDVVLEAIKEYAFPAAGEPKAYTIDTAVQIDHGDLDCLRPYPRPSTASAQR